MCRFVRLTALLYVVCVVSPLRAQTFEYQVEKPRTHETFAAGIRYTVDSAVDAGPARGVFKNFAAVVAFANGRGRLDVVSLSEGPVIRADGITITPPLGQSGDYYLFDSTGFILVRPSSKTFSSFSLDSLSVDYGDHPGAMFEYHIIRPETLATNGSRSTQAMLHGRIQLLGHVNMDQEDSTGKPRMIVVARGKMTVHDVPPGEVNVVRWFWPSFVLAALPSRADVDFPSWADVELPTDRVSVTTTAFLNPPAENSAPVSFGTLHYLSGLKRVAVDLSELVLPAGFTETRWPGFDGLPDLPPLLPDKGDKWRGVP